MKKPKILKKNHSIYCVAIFILLLHSNSVFAQKNSITDTEKVENTKDWTAEQDHQNMLNQLGITELRNGKNGWLPAGEPNAANYDETIANPYPDLPHPLLLNNGEKITSPEVWWKQRRPEIVEDFEREVYGRVPQNMPNVEWILEEQLNDGIVNGISVVIKKLIGKVDNSTYPEIDVNIEMVVVTPANANKKVPLLMMFSFGGIQLPTDTKKDNPILKSTNQLIEAGWGYALINPKSIQADNGAGLTKDIIGLVNKGEPRKPDDWGSLRAWAWGAARGLDYIKTDSLIDSKHVGIEGVSRYGKAALVTLALEPDFAMALVGSSGKGGAALHRRNFGESVENLTGSGEYHWMAGNYLKYGTEKSTFGRMDANNLPVDSHELIALCAPRLTFISYGIPEKGDSHWMDQQGSYMATVAASKVFKLLSTKDIGEKENYRTAKMPPAETGLLNGELAWRQHIGGHEDWSNMKYFIAWANKFISSTK